jgi:hypothetical protein
MPLFSREILLNVLLREEKVSDYFQLANIKQSRVSESKDLQRLTVMNEGTLFAFVQMSYHN